MSWRNGPNPLIEQRKIHEQLRQQRRINRMNQKRFVKENEMPFESELFPEEITLNDLQTILQYFQSNDTFIIKQSLTRLKLCAKNLDFIEPIIQSHLTQYLLKFALSNEVLLRAKSFVILAHLCASSIMV